METHKRVSDWCMLGMDVRLGIFQKLALKQGVVAHAYNPSVQEAEAGR